MAKKKVRDTYSSRLLLRLRGVNVKSISVVKQDEVPLYHPEPIRAYRLEVEICGDTYGPYTAGVHARQYEKVCDKMRMMLRGWIKEPDEDGCKKFQFGMLTGFQDIWLVRHWFGGVHMLKELMDTGFNLVEYEVVRAYPGESQVVWFKENATKIRSYNYEEVMDLLHE